MVVRPTNEVRSWKSASGIERQYKRFPFPVPPSPLGNPVQWTVNPFLTGPGIDAPAGTVDAATVVTCNPGTYTGTAPIVISYQWELNGTSIPGQTAATTTRVAGENLQLLTCRVTGVAANAIPVQATSNGLRVRDPAVTAMPAAVNPAHVMVDEIRSASDPDVGGTGGRQRMRVDPAISIPAGFDLYADLSSSSGGNTSTATAIAPGGTRTKVFSLGTGATFYGNLWFRRQSDGVFFPALPSSGTTAAPNWDAGVVPAPTGRPLTAHPTVPSRGQVSVTTLGLYDGTGTPATTWTPMTATVRNLALAVTDDTPSANLGRYVITGNNGAGAASTMVKSLHAGMVGCAYASFTGDSVADTQTVAWANRVLGSTNMPFACARPGAAREVMFITFWTLVKRTPRLWDDPTKISASMKAKADVIIRGIFFANVAYLSDVNTGGNWTSSPKNITGYANEPFSSMPNLSTGPLMSILAGVAHYGLTNAAAMIEAVDISDFITELNAEIGASSSMGVTYNWRTTSQTPGDFYRFGAHADAWTETQFHARLRGWRYGGYALTNLTNVLLPKPDTATGTAAGPSLNRALNPQMYAQGSNDWNGLVWDRPRSTRPWFDTWGDYIEMDISGTHYQYGLVSAARAALPHKGDGDCMYNELNGLDEGTRFSMPYAMWTRCMVQCALLSAAVADVLDLTDLRLQRWLHRFQKAETIIDYFDASDSRSIAHIDNTSPPSGYNGGAGTSQTALWSSFKSIYAMPVTQAIAQAIIRKLRVQLAPNFDFDGNVARWEARGSATRLYDAAEGGARVTVSGAGGGIGNVAANHSGTTNYNTTGHMRLKGGVAHDIEVVLKRDTYPAAGVVFSCNGDTTTTSVLTTSDATYTRVYTPPADTMLNFAVLGSGSSLGDFIVKAISIRPK